MDRCDQCGYLYDEAEAPDAVEGIVSGAAQLADLLRAHADTAARRPAPETWSPLEYGCHVRDVLQVQRERVLLARRVERPEPEPMGRDERADHDGYAAQDPMDVARQLEDAAALLANVFRRLGPDDWDRLVVYGFPGRAERTQRWVAVHTRHEVVHHLADARHGVHVAEGFVETSE